MFKPSTANKPAPLLQEIQPRGKGIPSNPPTAKERSGGSTNGVLAEIKPSKK
jgi:hypothetical protein